MSIFIIDRVLQYDGKIELNLIQAESVARWMNAALPTQFRFVFQPELIKLESLSYSVLRKGLRKIIIIIMYYYLFVLT